MPPKARLRLRITNTDSAELKLALHEIRKTYGIQDITINQMDSLNNQKLWNRDSKLDAGDVSDVKYQNELIADYLKRNFKLPDNMLDNILEINKSLNGEMPPSEIVQNVFWKLKKFKFSNMFSYGEDNIVDFEKLDGIVGLFAPNATGKSSLLDALSFCLFDTSSRAFKAEDVMNNKKDNFECEVNFTINDVEYGVKRIATRKKDGNVRLDVDFWVVTEDGERESLNGESRRPTNRNIRNLIGSYEDFILTSLSLQNNFTVFIDKKQRERKELLAQFMGIGIFDKLYTLAHENVSDVASVLKTFKKRDYDQELRNLEYTKKEYQSQDKTLERLKGTKENELDLLQVEIIKSHTQLKYIDDSIKDIDKLLKSKESVETSISREELELRDTLTLVENSTITYNQFKEQLAELEARDLFAKQEELKSYEIERINTKTEIDKLKIEIKNKLSKMEHLEDLEYDPDCDYCMNNIFVKDAIATKNELETDKITAGVYVEKIDNLDALISNLE